MKIGGIMVYRNNVLVNNKSYIDSITITNYLTLYLNELLNDKEYLSMQKYIQHGTTNCIEHSIAVTHYSIVLSHRLHMKVNYKSLIFGALLHDYFLYDWHEKESAHKWHGFIHPKIALKNSIKRWQLDDIQKDIIKCHMFPLTILSIPKYKESLIVCFIDKLCATYETFVKKKPYKNLKKLYNLKFK